MFWEEKKPPLENGRTKLVDPHKQYEAWSVEIRNFQPKLGEVFVGLLFTWGKPFIKR